MPLTIDFIGGVEGDRTPDLMNAIHALSQLSYDPNAFNALANSELLIGRLGRINSEKAE